MMEYRKMESRDIAAVADLEKYCFSDPWSEKSIRSELENPLSCWIVAADAGRLAGYVGSQTVLDGADMMNIAVDPCYRRQGIGQKLIEYLIEALTERGAECLSLEVRVSNAPACALYKKMGFYQAGCRPNYYRNPKEDAWILRKEWRK